VLPIRTATANVTAKGTLGTDPSGTVYLGRMKGRLDYPATDECAAETVLVVITLRGDVPRSGDAAELNQSWGYRGSTGGGGEGFCISAAQASGLVEFIPGLIGPLVGQVKPGAQLKSVKTLGTATGANATLSVAAP
jgi:hypothetical protein